MKSERGKGCLSFMAGLACFMVVCYILVHC